MKLISIYIDLHIKPKEHNIILFYMPEKKLF